MTQRLLWTSAAHSHVGKVRKINEDACLERPHLGTGGLWAVADGMGGHAAGDVASRAVVEALRRIPAPEGGETEFVTAVEQALEQVNAALREQATRQYQRRTIGSTVVVLLTHGEQGFCLWAGDSRIYRLRDGRLQQMTRDHSHVQELVERGLIESAEARHHPMANVITRAVGSQDTLQLDRVRFELAAGDVFLLCSDGLSKLLDDDEIERQLGSSNSRNAVQGLIQTALERGADDNVTTVVVSIHRQDDLDANGETIPLDSLAARLRRQG